jgi:hypothetical protein
MIRSGNYFVEIGGGLEWGGVNSTDALLVGLHQIPQKGHTLGGIYLLAADVNGDDFVDQTDEVLIQQRTISIIDEFPASDLVYSQSIVTVEGAATNYNIRVLCRGDVNASYEFEGK